MKRDGDGNGTVWKRVGWEVSRKAMEGNRFGWNLIKEWILKEFDLWNYTEWDGMKQDETEE